jgi:hypothetical protein
MVRQLPSVLDHGATFGAGNGTIRPAVAFIPTKAIEQGTGWCSDSGLEHKIVDTLSEHMDLASTELRGLPILRRIGHELSNRARTLGCLRGGSFLVDLFFLMVAGECRESNS